MDGTNKKLQQLNSMSILLTKRQAEVLRKMHDEDEELVYERGLGYVDLEAVGSKTVMALIRLFAVSACGDCARPGEGLEHYRINEIGISLLRDYFGG